MAKLDLKKELRTLYALPKEPVMVEVPPMRYLMIDGQGDPNTSQDYVQAIEALYGLSYTLKFMIKKADGQDYTVMPLEGLWWAEDLDSFLRADKDAYKWTALIMQPDLVTEDHVKKATAELKKKKDPPALPKVRFELFDEGLSAQITHVGSYSEERPTVERLHAFIDGQGHALRGKHHEIYMSDPRRTDTAKLKTIIRQPVGKKNQ
jgi:hypothetical protein